MSEVSHTGKAVYVETQDGKEEFVLKENDFTIDPSHIDWELCNMGKIMLDYGEVEVRLRVEVEQKETTLEKYKADLDAKIRDDAANSGDKLTEAKITNTIIGDDLRLALVNSISQSRSNHNMMQWAMRALQGKLQCLQALAYRDRQLMKADQFN